MLHFIEHFQQFIPTSLDIIGNADAGIRKSYGTNTECREHFVKCSDTSGKRNQDIEEMLEAIQAFRKVYFKKHREGRYLEKDRVDRLLEEREIGALLGRDDLMEWMSAPYDKLQKYPEHLIHMVKDDVAVRSKSEEIIMNVLDRYHIAYRYDCAIEINGHILHPDFILRDPKTGKFILWEHLGAMDKEEYRQNARWKLNQYMEAGYTPMLDLIITSETEKHPMDTYTAEAIVRMMFL